MNKVYAISSDGTKDGLSLTQVAKDTEGIIKILTKFLSYIEGNELIQDSVDVDYEAGTISFVYLDCGQLENGLWFFWTIDVV